MYLQNKLKMPFLSFDLFFLKTFTGSHIYLNFNFLKDQPRTLQVLLFWVLLLNENCHAQINIIKI